MAQVVTNLLNNAAKYTESGGDIWLTVEIRDGDLIIEVRHGSGHRGGNVAADFRAVHASGTPLDRPQGRFLGIGLSLVRRIVELHGGSVTVHSEGAR